MAEIRIVYCSPCGFATQAKELQNAVVNEFRDKVSVKLEKGDHGIFDVYVNNKKIFSRFKEKRFPEFEEIRDKVMDVMEEM